MFELSYLVNSLPSKRKMEKSQRIKVLNSMVILTMVPPLSDTPEPDMLSDSNLSLSGSVNNLDVSDLFFRIDLERLCDSTCGGESIESIDIDFLLSFLPLGR